MPDLNPEHKRLSRHGRNSIGRGIVRTSGRSTSIDDNFLKSVENLIVEGDKQKNNDTDRQNTSKNGAVLRFLPIPQQLRSIEEIKFIDNSLNTTPKTHHSLSNK